MVKDVIIHNVTEVVTYRQISFDTAHVARPERPFKASFFEASQYPYIDGSARVTEFDEKPIIRWLMLCPASRQLIFEELRLPQDVFYCPEVVQPFYAPGQGDLDLVFCPSQLPNRAIALECKRVKVETVNAGEDKINKLKDIAGGVHQANTLYNGPHAFFQTYLAIITEVTAAEQEERNIPTRGVRSHSTPQRGDTKRTTFRQIVEFPGREKLHKDVGILFIEVVQPSRLSIDKQATIRVRAYRQAEPREQLDAVTNRMMEIMR
jgi:hypothetical protein